ncbi:hypothetical protein HanPSC8_Chr03g0095791 [Helianthus annuus]|nr:hypothetical protein HanIR_Chr03g0108541 [Helianthus annuus]KAJ0942748.1 hypothetical protein HanPSC8_Chr03g0095791 [Helianthus annuus]
MYIHLSKKTNTPFSLYPYVSPSILSLSTPLSTTDNHHSQPPPLPPNLHRHQNNHP